MDSEKLDLLTNIRLQVDAGFKRRNKGAIKAIFDLHKDSGTELLTPVSLRLALIDLDVHVSEAEVTQFIQTMDLNNDGGLDFQEFLNVIDKPTPVELWARSLPLAELIASAMPRNGGENKDSLRCLSRITPAELEASCMVLVEGLKKLLEEQIEALKKSFETLDQSSASGSSEAAKKFQVITMSVGNIGNFHEGLAARIGI
jgi:Ca2+-binding EF-hand superfamily protein